ncbi:MAG: hypothetical protein ACYCVB_02250 [Bacilli bacterium]
MRSMPAQIGMASLLFALCLLVPVSTNLGQGGGERDIVSWRGIYNEQSGRQFLRIAYLGAPALEVSIAGVSPRLFPFAAGPQEKGTPLDSPQIIADAYRSQPRLIQSVLGTYENVASLTDWFPNYPVAFSVGLLRKLSALHVNPMSFGGPDIVPGRVPFGRLKGHVLHIDTLPDNNTLSQCSPGQVPQELVALRPVVHTVRGEGV